MKLRTILFWMHLITGVTALVVIFIMSITGVLLTYERQMVDWYDTRNYQAAPPSPDTPRLRPDELITAVQTALPDAAITGITLRADPTAPAAIAVERRTFFVNPYTGEVWGEREDGLRAFFNDVMGWHTRLGVSREFRGIGSAFVGACNLALVFIVLSGFYLWWPRKWSWRTVRNVTWFRRGLPGKARDFNWHNVIGFWCSIPLFIIAVSGVIFSYPWANTGLYRMFGETPPVRGGQSGGPPRNSGQVASEKPTDQSGPNAPQSDEGDDDEPEVYLERVSRLWAHAEQQVDDWQTITVRLPTVPDAPLAFVIDRGTGGQPQKQSTLTLDVKTGEVVGWAPFSSLNPGRRTRRSMRFAHTGEIGGLAGQTVAGIVSAAACFMVWTGLALTWRRFFGRSEKG